MDLVIVGLIIFILIIIVVIYFIEKPNYQIPIYKNKVLSIISTIPSWVYYLKPQVPIDYSLKIIKANANSVGTMQISYLDDLGGYLQGYVTFIADFSPINLSKISIKPIKLISTATNRWPQNQTWTLEYTKTVNSNGKILNVLILNDGKNNYNLQPV